MLLYTHLRVPVLLFLALALQVPWARAEDKTVGGHVGFGFPLVTHGGGDTTTINDFFRMSLPVAITVSGSGRLYFDLEFVPGVVDRPRDISLTVNPGFLWRLGHGFAAGARAGFDVRTSSFGITPLVVKSFPIEHSFFKAYFIETDYVFRFDRPPDGRATNPFTFNLVLGLAF